MKWFAVIIALCPGVAWAADFDALDAEYAAIVEGCFDAAPAEDRAAREACIGVAFDECERRPSVTGGSKTIGCYRFAADAWRRLMERELAALRGEIGSVSSEIVDIVDPVEVAERLAAFDASQAAWEDYSVAQCRYGGAKWPGGDMGRFDRAICDRDLAARRAIFLWQECQPMPWPDYRGWE